MFIFEPNVFASQAWLSYLMGPDCNYMIEIKVISTKDGVQKEVSYSTLDKQAQEEVLTDLLVKSAVHYAMKKQQVIVLRLG